MGAYEFQGANHAQNYCTGKTNGAGCVAMVVGSGGASASAASPFTLTAVQVINGKAGLLFYGFGSAALPFQGGTLCVQAPLRRSSINNSGGSPSGTDCSGSLSDDFNARIQSGVDPALVVGVEVYAQFYYRDPGNTFGVGLSDAVKFAICQ
jgi:hypothetical protein